MQDEEYGSEDESERTALKLRIEKILDNDISKEASNAFKAPPGIVLQSDCGRLIQNVFESFFLVALFY